MEHLGQSLKKNSRDYSFHSPLPGVGVHQHRGVWRGVWSQDHGRADGLTAEAHSPPSSRALLGQACFSTLAALCNQLGSVFGNTDVQVAS